MLLDRPDQRAAHRPLAEFRRHIERRQPRRQIVQRVDLLAHEQAHAGGLAIELRQQADFESLLLQERQQRAPRLFMRLAAVGEEGVIAPARCDLRLRAMRFKAANL